MSDACPSFEEWVAYCFEYGYSDFQRFGSSKGTGFDAILARQERFSDSLPSPTLTEYATLLFSAPEFIAVEYSADQIADATWFLFGVASCYFHNFRDSDVPRDAQIALMRSVAAMYTNLFDRVCNKRGADPDTDYTNTNRIDIAVYMIWDMDSIEFPLTFPSEQEHLVAPSMEVLETALFQCRTASCKTSALHGLGHVAHVHPEWVLRVIDAFLKLTDQPEHLREYAKSARAGCIL